MDNSHADIPGPKMYENNDRAPGLPSVGTPQKKSAPSSLISDEPMSLVTPSPTARTNVLLEALVADLSIGGDHEQLAPRNLAKEDDTAIDIDMTAAAAAFARDITSSINVIEEGDKNGAIEDNIVALEKAITSASSIDEPFSTDIIKSCWDVLPDFRKLTDLLSAQTGRKFVPLAGVVMYWSAIPNGEQTLNDKSKRGLVQSGIDASYILAGVGQCTTEIILQFHQRALTKPQLSFPQPATELLDKGRIFHGQDNDTERWNYGRCA